jgi:general secretion pathway protein G
MDTQRNRNARRSAGFTLIEVLLVIVIIGMLATVLIVTVGGTGEGAKIDTTKLSLDKLSNRIEMYAMHMGHVPTEADGGLNALMTEPAGGEEKAGEKKWRGPYAEERELVDAWQNKFNYEPVEAGTSVGGKKFKLWSNGPDGQSNTADDLKNWTEANT